MDPILHMPNHEKGPGWYRFSEDWTETFGPYASEEEAKEALEKSDPRATIFTDAVDAANFWHQEHEIARDGEIVDFHYSLEQRIHAWEYQAERPKDLSIETVGDLYELEGLVDGGYLSFVYGSRRGNFGGWDVQKFKYSNYLILMDSGGVRKAEYEDYKSRRHDRRQLYDYMRETYEMVKQFRDIMLNDPAVKTSYLEGYEADDLIALLHLKGIGKHVIAQDKDMFMVKGLREKMYDHHGVSQGNRDLKLPKYAIPPRSPGSWAFTQAIFGDKSDSIPRLLPSRSGYKQEYDLIVRRAKSILQAYYNAYHHYGEQFLINLRLVLLPHPTLPVKDYDDYNRLFVDVAKGTYWSPENYSNSLLETVVQNMQIYNW